MIIQKNHQIWPNILLDQGRGWEPDEDEHLLLAGLASFAIISETDGD